jgi:hypothetical protein
MATPPPGAQISDDGYYWLNQNTGDPNEPARWELIDDQGAASQSSDPAQSTAPAQASDPAQSTDPAQTSSQDPSQQQSEADEVTLDWEYSANDDLSVGLDDLVASGWEPGSEDETA